MSNASTLVAMSLKLRKVAERARREPEGRFHSLAHLIDVSALERAYRRIRKDAAVGVDGITKEQYGADLERSLQNLHARLKSKRYRHQPIRRVHIPKDKGKTRPIGLSAFEDKLVQGAVREVLEAIYEQDCMDCSYGFRPRRSAHDALRTLDRAVADLPVATWNYKAQDDSIRHMGPMAQDFYAAFGLGLGEKTIDTIDPNGVALAAIQGLNAKLQERLAERDAEIAENRVEIQELRAANEALVARMERLEESMRR